MLSFRIYYCVSHFSPAEFDISKEGPPKWKDVEVVTMENQERWKSIFENLAKQKQGVLVFAVSIQTSAEFFYAT